MKLTAQTHRTAMEICVGDPSLLGILQLT